MTILSPIAITNFTTNVTETEFAAYVPATSYAISTVSAPVKVIYNHRIYESLQGANTGNQPDISSAWWLDTGATNAYACIDSKVSSQTVGTGLNMTWTHGQSSKIHIINCETNEATITIEVGGIPVQTISKVGLYRDNISTYWDWFTKPFKYNRNFDFDVQYNPLATVRLTTTGASKIGIIASGIENTVGDMQWGAKPGFIDYSKKDVDQWGETYLKQGAWSARMSGEVVVKSSDIDAITEAFIAIRGTANVFYGGGGYNALKVYGFVREFDPLISNPTISTYNLTIEGLI